MAKIFNIDVAGRKLECMMIKTKKGEPLVITVERERFMEDHREEIHKKIQQKIKREKELKFEE